MTPATEAAALNLGRAVLHQHRLSLAYEAARREWRLRPCTATAEADRLAYEAWQPAFRAQSDAVRHLIAVATQEGDATSGAEAPID